MLQNVDAGLSPSAPRSVAPRRRRYCVEAGADGTAFEYKYSIGVAAPAVNGQIIQGSC